MSRCNVGSKTPYDSAQWVEYMTSKRECLAGQRAAQERPRQALAASHLSASATRPGAAAAICGAEYAADVNRRYATFANTPREMGTLEDRRAAAMTTISTFAETMMKDGGRFDGLSRALLHRAAHLPRQGAGHWVFPKANGPPPCSMRAISTRSSARRPRSWTSTIRRRRSALYVDEWGTWYDPAPGSNPGFLVQQNSLRDAEVAALSLNIFQRHTDRVKGANIAQMINVLQAMIMTDGPKMVLTPTYHVFDMYQAFMGATPYAATTDRARTMPPAFRWWM